MLDGLAVLRLRPVGVLRVRLGDGPLVATEVADVRHEVVAATGLQRVAANLERHLDGAVVVGHRALTEQVDFGLLRRRIVAALIVDDDGIMFLDAYDVSQKFAQLIINEINNGLSQGNPLINERIKKKIN